MANIKPFRAVRPAADKVKQVITQPYNFYDKNELEQLVSQNPYSFLHVLNPFIGHPTTPSTDSHHYLNAIRDKFLQFIDKKIFIKETKPQFYIYTQKIGNHFYTGIIALSSVDDYLNNVIKKHEATLTNKEERLKEYLSVVNINAEPVCIAYEDSPEIDEIIISQQKEKPLYDFSTPDQIEHWLWGVYDEDVILKIENAFKQIPAIYIADGHHRAASSSRYALERREKDKNYTGDEPYNYFMSIFFSEKQIAIHEFNRVVKDLNGLSAQDFLENLKNDFEVKALSKAEKPKQAGQINIYLEGNWYNLKAQPHCFEKSSKVGSLDSQILTEVILKKQLNIQDIKTDKRIDFVSGTAGMKKLEKMVDSGQYKVAFVLYPITFHQLKEIADHNEIMPPKTTWVTPKLRSALTIFEL